MCTSALRRRLASTWRSCPGSPSTTRVIGPVQRDRAIGRDGARVVDRVAGERHEVDRLADLLADLVQAREREQVLDEHAHPRRLVLDARHRLLDVLGLRGGADPKQLGVAADRRQRRAQLMRRVGEEAAQALLARAPLGERLLEAREHRVEREAEAPDLGARLGGLDAAARSPAAIAPAVAPIASSGRRPIRTIHQAPQPSASSTPPKTRPSMSSRRESAASTSVSGIAAITSPPPGRRSATRGSAGRRSRVDGDRLAGRERAGSFGAARRRLAGGQSRGDMPEHLAGGVARLAVDRGWQVRRRAPPGPRVPPGPPGGRRRAGRPIGCRRAPLRRVTMPSSSSSLTTTGSAASACWSMRSKLEVALLGVRQRAGHEQPDGRERHDPDDEPRAQRHQRAVSRAAAAARSRRRAPSG